MLLWPNEFLGSTPATDFGASLVALFDQIIASGGSVRAVRDWALFSFSRDNHAIYFVRRGRLRGDSGTCWEVCLYHDGEEQKLGRLFGIRPHACVVISGFEDLRAVTDCWLDGLPLDSVAHCATFWDRSDTSRPLESLTSSVAAERRVEQREFAERGAPPCPYCGSELRSNLAQQCFECGADWHEASSDHRRHS
jgi:hypothetical protein